MNNHGRYLIFFLVITFIHLIILDFPLISFLDSANSRSILSSTNPFPSLLYNSN
ncbi:hypothetical protein BO83DRAFT_376424 [Aspergillus eucalypticola CBS 122712]|uniref:Uncharacterized protein n=1 Tax=Aspergillus eucalypticola (strain CBS 122712 / IBT 29274) TaxID=1448314 RepID=A0A317VWZ2_ASPEC|nr:uncharacterized protein BO83DRAFT_376424 [Aspergillus eucalypticola CBS 122712]PWY78884.1 hypothetical protein BO83DRAFT_376424 [Aspergillus eucalypticola CBS 122712]